jgi:hypothetical protein
MMMLRQQLWYSSESTNTKGASKVSMKPFGRLPLWICMSALLLPCASLSAEKTVSTAPSSGRYRLDVGKGYTVCESFLRNLNAFPATDKPMMCEQKIHPSHPEFTKPSWQGMDVQGNLRLIYDAEALSNRFSPAGSTKKPFNEWVAQYQEKIRAGSITPKLQKAVLNINGNGPETLIWYEPLPDQCANNQRVGLPSEAGGYIFVLRNKNGKLESIAALSDEPSDVFLYKGRPYFTPLTGPDFRYFPPKGGRPGRTDKIWLLRFLPLVPGPSRLEDGRYGLNTDMCAYSTPRLDTDFPKEPPKR